MTCKHDIAEQDTYVADGYCPLCLLDQIQRLQARVAKLEAANRKLWRGYFDLPKLDSEVENNE